MKPDYHIRLNSDSSILVSFTCSASFDLASYIHSLNRDITISQLDHFVESVCAYDSLLLIFQPEYWDIKHSIKQLELMINNHKQAKRQKNNKIEIPVCYDQRVAEDLDAVCQQKNISHQQLITLHSQANYRVEMLGFLPGFLYLSGLDASLHTARKSTPSLSVPPGSVAIGGSQTGLYSISSPGGWNIIGRTPLKTFDINRFPPCLVQPLDEVRFVSIDYQQFIDYEH